MMQRFLTNSFPVEDREARYVKVEDWDYLIEPLEMDTFWDLYQNDSVGSFLRLWEYIDNPVFSGRGIHTGVSRWGYFRDITLDMIREKLFPRKRLNYPSYLSATSYTLAYFDRYPDADGLTRLEDGIARQLGLTVTRSTQSETLYSFSVKNEKLLVPAKGDDKKRRLVVGNPNEGTLPRITLTELAGILTKYTDHLWSYAGKNRKMYAFTLNLSSLENAIEGLKKYGLRTQKKRGEVEVLTFVE